MKKLLLTGLVIFMGMTMTAQNDEIELFQSAFKIEKKAMLMDFLMLNETESKAFWPLYDAYQEELSKTANRRIGLVKKYVEYYDTMTDEQANDLMNESYKIRDNREELQRSYSRKIKKSLGGKRAAQFVQFERYIQVEIDAELNDSHPLIGE